ncbi:MAG: NUDIX hydrolase [Candidatus Altiarchaeota archaeon]|nr:NUDIX hydrolase [Candidatus Altiarchaeota archaeon]
MKDDGELSWTEISRELVMECRIFDLYKVRRSSPDGKKADIFLLDTPDWVTVLPVVQKDGKDNFLMVRQYRQGSAGITMEFPAGTVEPGENPEKTVRRELLEETGYVFGKITPLGKVNPNPAFMNNTFHAYLAEEVVSVEGQNLDEDEHIHTRLVPAEEVIRDLRTGEYINGTQIAALLFCLRWKGALPVL